MDRSKLADLSEIISSIAIFATLIYLTVEIRQNTLAVQTQTAQAVLQAGQTELAMIVENPEIALSIPKSGPLTSEQNVILDAYFASNMRNREFAWVQYKNGTIGDVIWDSEITVLRVQLDSYRFREWWNKLGRHYVGQEYANFVDKLVDEGPATDRFWSGALDWSSE